MASPKFLTATVNVNLHGLRRFQSALQADMRLGSSGPARQAIQDWVTIYARFLTRRYFIFSQGGGNWRPLKPATIFAKARKKLLLFILRATDLMFQSFAPEFAAKPGRISEQVPFGMRVGFSGGMSMTYPSGKTVAEVAGYHQRGGRYLPRRPIIVPPDKDTRRQMRDRMQQALNQMAKAA